MRRACRPSPAWLRWALVVCAAVLLAPRPSSGQCAGPEFGTFAGPNVSGEPWGVVTGDFWGATGAPDGALDVVVAKRSANMVTLLRGDGAGSFMSPIDFPVGAGPTDVVAADFNRDGLLDLAVVVDAQALPPVNRVQLLPGTGSGFGAITDLGVGDLPSRLATGDFNRDGKPDLVVVSWSAETVQVYEGDGILGFTLQTPQPVIPADIPVAAVSGDFNLDGRLDLAVSIDDPGLAGRVLIYLGDGTGHLGDTPSTENPFATITVGTTPLDIRAGDVNRDGKPDLVTADLDSVALSVLTGVGNGTFTREPSSPAVGAGPVRAVLEDFDRDGLLDVATLNPPGSPPHVTVLPGSAVTPFFDAGSPTALLLSPSSTHEGLAAGDLDADGRPDLVATEGTDGNVVVALNTASPDCPRTSFLDAPRAFPGGNGAVWAAVGDLNGDGLDDLVIAASLGNRLEVLLNTGNGYAPAAGLSVGGAARGVAAADFDVDGNVDVVAAVGDEVQLFLGAGDGTLAPGTALPAGSMTSAVVAGDFNGDGAPDVAATAQLASFLYVFLGDGVGGLTALTPIALGSGSRSLDAGDIDNNGTLDLVVARESTDDVVVLEGVGDGTFTPHPDSPLSVGDAPWGVTLGHLDGDSLLDVATADQNASTITVWFRSALPAAGFENPVTRVTPDRPFSVAALDVTDDGNGDVAAVIADNTLVLFSGNGDRTFNTLVPHPVRRRPSSIAAVDADADGRPDLAVPCKDADSVVVLLARPPVLARAPVVSVGSAPTGVVSADFDANGTLDLAVVNSADNEVTVLDNDGSGGFTPRPTSPVSVGAMSPKSIVVADFDRDGVLDLATSNSASDNVSILFGALTPVPTFAAGVTTAAGLTPDDLVVSDFDRDGDPDLAVCNSVSSGTVTFLSNNGAGVLASQGTVDVGNSPTSIFAADFDGNGWPDIAVANDNSADLTVRYNDGTWSFTSSQTLLLTGGDTSPVSVTGGDFDGDGDVDLATVAFGSSMLSVYENTGASFATTPTRFDAADQPLFVTAADLNRDGAPDLAAAADGMKVLPAQGGVLDFFPSEDVIAGRQPVELAVGDFNRDGVPDVAVVNEVSDDVSILLSSACQARRLVLSVSPPACGLVGPPYPVPATVQVQDDGGNLALCATGAVTGSVVPGTGGGGVYSGLPNPVPVSGGEALFNNHDITLAGPRYRLQFDLPGVSKVVSRSFTLEPSITITGPPSVCSMATYTAEPLVPPFDSYEWTLDVNPPPHGFGPTTTVDLADGLGPHTLWVDARMDGCVATDTTSIYVGDLTSVDISTPGATTVCVDCLGGTVTTAHTGGGTPYTHQWGYRTTSGSPTIFDIPGQTAPTYVINGLDFPGVGTYYLVETTRSACGTDVVSTNEIPVTITASVPGGEVDSLGATSRGPGGVGENVLQWKNTVGTPAEILVRWNKAATGSSICSPPPDPTTLPVSGEDTLTGPFTSTTVWTHGPPTYSPLELDTAYCYSVFVKPTAVGPYSPGRTVKARPFDTTSGPIWWAYATGATAVAPPTVGFDGVVALSNDRSVHSLERGINGGTWPSAWVPPILNGVVHSRSPIMPMPAPADPLLLVGDDSGELTAINTRTGLKAWGPISFSGAMITGAPGAFAVRWGGPADVVLVGTRVGGAGYFYTRDLATGGPIDTYDGGGALGPVTTTPVLDYGTGQAYFTSWGLTVGTTTAWCVDVDAAGSMTRCTGWTLPDLDDIDASPVLENGRVYVANTAGEVYPLDPADGTSIPPVFDTGGDGPVKGFLFPDRRGSELYFATDSQVWSVTDTAGTLSTNWTWDDGPGFKPSMVLHWPGTDYLFVGSDGGKLYQLEISGGRPSTPCTPPSCKVVVLGDGSDHIGTPSLDIGVAPPLLHVGSEAGVVYAVEVPLP